MGLLDFLTSTKRPAPGTPALSEDEVRKRLLDANRPTAPWRVTDGKADGVDYVAEWKIADSEWKEVFKKAGVTSVFRVLLKVVPADRSVHSSDREYELKWESKMKDESLKVSLTASASRGQKQEISFGKPVAFRETVTPDQIHSRMPFLLSKRPR